MLLGKYTGGELIIHEPIDSDSIDIRDGKSHFSQTGKLLFFDGLVTHESTPIEKGDRYSIIPFYHKKTTQLNWKQHQALRSIGFVLPYDTCYLKNSFNMTMG